MRHAIGFAVEGHTYPNRRGYIRKPKYLSGYLPYMPLTLVRYHMAKHLVWTSEGEPWFSNFLLPHAKIEPVYTKTLEWNFPNTNITILGIDQTSNYPSECCWR